VVIFFAQIAYPVNHAFFWVKRVIGQALSQHVVENRPGIKFFTRNCSGTWLTKTLVFRIFNEMLAEFTLSLID
jgi:hypothetical protein